MVLNDWVDRFAVWQGLHPDLQTLLIYGVGIAVYTALVFAVYQNISRRDPLHTKQRPGWWGRTVHATETALTFPILSLGYLVVLSLALFLMAKPDRATSDILLLSMAAVLGVRVTAHLSEKMSNDIAKLLPLSLLAVVVVDPGYLSIGTTIARIADIWTLIPVLTQYFALFIVVEATLRGLRAIFPGLGKLAHHFEHKRHLSKRAMLRDIEGEHGGGSLFKRHAHHEHAPRDRGGDFIALDENAGGKPGSRQGVGPAIPRAIAPGVKAKHAHAPAAQHAHRPTPRAGPGGSGGKLGPW